MMNVVDKNRLQGHVIQEVQLPPNSERWVLLHFENGQLVLVPSQLLIRDKDGSYRLAASVEELVTKQVSIPSYKNLAESSPKDTQREHSETRFDEPRDLSQVIPVTEERATVEQRKVPSATVTIHKRVQEQTEVVDPPLQSEEVEIDRVAVNRIVEEAIQPHYEGDTLILPLLEEVLVVEKRLLLREEVHIRKLRKEVHAPQEVLLRKEEVDVERVPFSDKGAQS